MNVRIGQASLGETGAHGQQAGNQTGRELNFSRWYAGSWLFVLRFLDAAKAELAAQACEAGVKNRNIGYDQDGRTWRLRPRRGLFRGWPGLSGSSPRCSG